MAPLPPCSEPLAESLTIETVQARIWYGCSRAVRARSMTAMSELILRGLLPIVLAAITAILVDVWSVKRRVQGPALVAGAFPSSSLRRFLFLALFSFGFLLVVYQSLATLGLESEVDMSTVSAWQLFWVHGILVVLVASWYLLGFAGVIPRAHLAREWCRQLGLEAPDPRREILLGVGLGAVGWLVVLILVSVIGWVTTALGGAGALPQEVPQSIVWMASLSIPLRLLIALSAGVVEELFFRGLLQPRLGILVSSILFILAHLSYGQPFLLVGISLLSFGFAFLARWRGSIWAAMAAHFTFDAIQLLILIPAVLRLAGL